MKSEEHISNSEKFIIGALITLTIVVIVLAGISAITKNRSENQYSKVTPLSELPPTWTIIPPTSTKVSTITPTIEIIKDLDLTSLVPSLSDLPDSYALDLLDGPEILEGGIKSFSAQFNNYGGKQGDPITVTIGIREFPKESIAKNDFNERLEYLSNEKSRYQYVGSNTLGSKYEYVDDMWWIYWVESTDLWAIAFVRIDHVILHMIYSVKNIEYTNFDKTIEPFDYLDISIEKVGVALGK